MVRFLVYHFCFSPLLVQDAHQHRDRELHRTHTAVCRRHHRHRARGQQDGEGGAGRGARYFGHQERGLRAMVVLVVPISFPEIPEELQEAVAPVGVQ
jgi:hypothetical protein